MTSASEEEDSGCQHEREGGECQCEKRGRLLNMETLNIGMSSPQAAVSRELKSWRAGELESWRAGELEA